MNIKEFWSSRVVDASARRVINFLRFLKFPLIFDEKEAHPEKIVESKKTIKILVILPEMVDEI